MTLVSGHFETVKRILSERAFIDHVNDDTVDLIFPTYGLAHVFKNQHERDIGTVYAGKTIRWRWKEWNNKPACLIAQIAILRRMEKWTDQRFFIEDDNARKSCECYGCNKGTSP